MKIVNYLMIGTTIRIGREILCLPYAEFFLLLLAGPKSGRPTGGFSIFVNMSVFIWFSCVLLGATYLRSPICLQILDPLLND